MNKFQNSSLHRYGNVISSNLRIENKKTIMQSTQKLGRVIEFTNKPLYNPFCDELHPCSEPSHHDILYPISPINEEEGEAEAEAEETKEPIELESIQVEWNEPFHLAIEEPELLTEDIYKSEQEDFMMDRTNITPSIIRSGMETLRLYKRSASMTW